jgi:hypothetical protein
VAHNLRISYAVQDTSTLLLIREALFQAYEYVKDWFGYQDDIAIDLWMAPTVADLQYMICMPCDEGYACAPGTRNGANVILFVSPLSCQKNAYKDRLTSILAHEITHHVVREISRATLFSMKRKEERDVPMWLEEGLCQLIQSELNPFLQHEFADDIIKTTKWYDLKELWNDLSLCNDVKTAYLQAYKQTKSFVEMKGKAEVIQLLYQNRIHDVNWNNMQLEK